MGGWSGTGTVTVAVADDHTVVRTGTRYALERAGLRVVAETARLDEVEAMARAHRPSVLVLDLMFGDSNALDVLPRLSAGVPETGLLLQTAHDEQPFVTAALAAGARGYVLKEASEEQLVAAVAAVARGEQYLQPELVTRFLAAPASTPVSAREEEALHLWADGHSNVEVARRMHLSTRTVEGIRATLRTRLGLTDRAHLVRFARDRLAHRPR